MDDENTVVKFIILKKQLIFACLVKQNKEKKKQVINTCISRVPRNHFWQRTEMFRN